MLFGNYNNNLLKLNNYETANPYFCNGSVTGSLFAGTNSIFNFNPLNSFMGGNGCNLFMNCNGQMNYGAMAGFSVGSMLLNLIGFGVGQAVSNRRENASSKQNVEADLNALYEKKEAILEKAGKTESEIMNFDISSAEETKKYNDAKTAYDGNEKTIKAYTEDKENIEKIIENYTATNLPQGTSRPSTEEYNAAKAKKDAHDAAITKRSGLEKAMKDAKTKMEALEEKMKKAKADLVDINDKIKNAEGELDTQLLTKAIGKEKRLISDDDYSTELGKLTDSNDATKPEFTKAHLRKAASKYKKAQTQDDKTKYANEFKQIYQYLLEHNSGEITSDMEAIYGVICS